MMRATTPISVAEGILLLLVVIAFVVLLVCGGIALWTTDMSLLAKIAWTAGIVMVLCLIAIKVVEDG